MPATYEPIATTTLGSAASSITFSSIPSTYTDLRLVIVGQGSGNGYYAFRFNGVSTNTYNATYLVGNGSAVSSARLGAYSSGIMHYSGFIPTTQWSMATLDVFSYAGSTNKTCLSDYSADTNGSGSKELGVTLWSNTSAITSITIRTDSAAQYAVGTTATLYGILRA